jgi:hypothetical protein
MLDAHCSTLKVECVPTFLLLGSQVIADACERRVTTAHRKRDERHEQFRCVGALIAS